jgi:hypothetical protein
MGDPQPGPAIIIVSGHPRSGTSLVMQMLEAAGVPILCDDARQPDDLNPNGYYELDAVKATARDSAWVARAPGHAVKVIHALLRHLPRDRSYRVILLERDLREVIASQTRMLEAIAQAKVDPPDSRLAEIYAQQLDEARQLLDREPCFEWIEVRHADLIAGDRNPIRAICRLLGLSAGDEAMSAAIDPKLYRSRAVASGPDGEA